MSRFKALLLIIIWVVSTQGQPNQLSSLIQLYQKQDFIQLKSAFLALKPGQLPTEDAKFFEAVFMTEAEQAQKKYSAAFEKGSPAIRKLAAEKLMDYYYAIGYYVTATKYQKYLVEHPEDVVQKKQTIITAPPAQGTYYIQVGAFGLEANAAQRVQFLKTQDIVSEIVVRKVHDKTLYCVWIRGDSDLDKNLEYAKKIKQKYDLEFQIMKK